MQLESDRKQLVLSHVAPSFTAPIADSVVIKSEGLFFLTARDGSVPRRGKHGLGLYYHDCRYLDAYELRLRGGAPRALVATASQGDRAVLELTNPDANTKHSARARHDMLGIRWERALDGARLTLTDTILLRNRGQHAATVALTLSFRARFEDIFVVRGMLPPRPRRGLSHVWADGALVFQYKGVDEVERRTSLAFSPNPDSTTAATATWHVKVASRRTARITVAISLTETPNVSEPEHIVSQAKKLPPAKRPRSATASDLRAGQTIVEGDEPILGRLIDRSLADLQMLRTNIGGAEFFAAGVPWFVTLFGRDSIVTALQMLAFDSRIAEQTLLVLARYQGTRVDSWREEQPGKVLHELRVDELTRANLIPYSPYYGTIDATPLFLVLVARHAAWTGSMRLFDELRENIDRALAWITQYGDISGDGYVAYDSSSKNGALINQGWKDSGDAIVNADGSIVVPPVALVEVQAYVYRAKREIADLLRRAGDSERAATLDKEADALRKRFNRDFWNESMGSYVLALQRDNRPAAVVSSNPGHALWCGIAEPDKARRTMERLMRDDMFSGWGIRTLATSEERYDPIGYHLGTVWPHDNSIIAAGFRRYGFDAPAQRVIEATVHAAEQFEHLRLPELFAGFTSAEFDVPVHYPVADHPQAWGAGSIPYMLTTLLGLEPDAFANQLRIVRPLLPPSVNRLDVRQLRVGEATVDLRLRRTAHEIAVDILRVDGELDVIVDRAGS